MKKHVFLLLLTFTVLFCAQAQSLGAGVSIDAQGSLKIDAPLYVIDNNPKNPKIKPAPSTMNLKVIARIYLGGNREESLEITGGIVKGRLSITVKKPDMKFFTSVATLDNIPAELFTNGADVQIGDIILKIDDEGIKSYDFFSFGLYSNYQVKLSAETERESYYIDGYGYYFTYSLGDVNISCKFNQPLENRAWYREIDIHFKPGWNITRYGEYFDNELQRVVDTQTSTLPPPNAVWVLFKI